MMRLEDELILACSRCKLSEQDAGRIRDLCLAEINWKYVRDASMRHGVFPLVHNSLLNVCPNELPASLLKEFSDLYRANAVHNIHLTSALLEIISSFENKNIPVVPFKGPVLAQFVYGDPGMRIFGDLDILISKADTGRASSELIHLGYKPVLNLSLPQMRLYMAYEDDLIFIHEKTGVCVELHWELTGRCLSLPMDMDFVNDNMQSVRVLGKVVSHLSYENLLIYLCVHGARHMWARIEWLYSIAELLSDSHVINWDIIWQKADQLRCRRFVLHALVLAEDIFCSKIPHDVEEVIKKDNALPALNEIIKSRLFPFGNDEQKKGQEPGARFSKYQLMLRDSWYEKNKYLVLQLIGPREVDWHWISLPGFFSVFYFFLRPVRLIVQFVSNKLGTNIVIR